MDLFPVPKIYQKVTQDGIDASEADEKSWLINYLKPWANLIIKNYGTSARATARIAADAKAANQTVTDFLNSQNDIVSLKAFVAALGDDYKWSETKYTYTLGFVTGKTVIWHYDWVSPSAPAPAGWQAVNMSSRNAVKAILLYLLSNVSLPCYYYVFKYMGLEEYIKNNVGAYNALPWINQSGQDFSFWEQIKKYLYDLSYVILNPGDHLITYDNINVLYPVLVQYNMNWPPTTQVYADYQKGIKDEYYVKLGYICTIEQMIARSQGFATLKITSTNSNIDIPGLTKILAAIAAGVSIIFPPAAIFAAGGLLTEKLATMNDTSLTATEQNAVYAKQTAQNIAKVNAMIATMKADPVFQNAAASAPTGAGLVTNSSGTGTALLLAAAAATAYFMAAK